MKKALYLCLLFLLVSGCNYDLKSLFESKNRNKSTNSEIDLNNYPSAKSFATIIDEKYVSIEILDPSTYLSVADKWDYDATGRLSGYPLFLKNEKYNYEVIVNLGFLDINDNKTMKRMFFVEKNQPNILEWYFTLQQRKNEVEQNNDNIYLCILLCDEQSIYGYMLYHLECTHIIPTVCELKYIKGSFFKNLADNNFADDEEFLYETFVSNFNLGK